MSAIDDPGHALTLQATDSDALIERISGLPEPEALKLYSQLSPRLQWLARKKVTGQRRSALITYHAIMRAPHG